MDHVRLGTSDLFVSRVGFGSAALSGYDYGPIDEPEATRAIRRAYELGVTLFDTADVYGFGRAETLLSESLGDARHHVVLATKGGIAWDSRGRTRRDVSAVHIRSAVDASLARLKVDAVPLYQIHWLDGTTPIDDVMETLSSLQEAGKVEHLGICNVGSDVVSAAQARSRIESVQLPLSLLDGAHGRTLSEAIGTHTMGTLAYNVLGQGLLAGASRDAARLHPSDLRFRSPLFEGAAYERGRGVQHELTSMAAALGRSAPQLAIRWVLDQPQVTAALVGAKTRRQVEENVGALGWSMDESVRASLDALARDNAASRAGGPAPSPVAPTRS